MILVVLLALPASEPAQGITRLSFTRPGGMMRIPMSATVRSPYLFTAGFVSEVVNISPYNSATGVYCDSELTNNMRLGLSTVTVADTTRDLENSTLKPPLEIGIHLQQRLWTYGNVSFSLGIQDVVLIQSDEGFSIDPDLISYLGLISSDQVVGKYLLSTYMGFGTGTLAGSQPVDTTVQLADSTSQIKVGVFTGFRLKTPIFAQRGGLDLMAEWDGAGINFGLRIPITPDYRIQIGAIHIDKLPQFGSQGNKEVLTFDAPAIVISLNLNIPRIIKGEAPSALEALGPRPAAPVAEEGLLAAQLDSTLKDAEFVLASLRDSLRIADFEIDNLHGQLAQRNQSGIVMIDSARSMQLRIEMMKSNMNVTMRHLSASLQHYYKENYRDALQEVEMAIQLNPDLAIAYARRGAIYYKLGDTQRATINWNMALKLDPEYDDIRNALRALKENRLKTASFIQE